MVYCHPPHKHEESSESPKKGRRLADNLMMLIGFLGSVSSLPQVWKIYQTGEVAGISITTYLLALFVIISWLVYGIYIKNKPLILTTSITTLISFVVIVQVVQLG